jgi:hypothetical protein
MSDITGSDVNLNGRDRPAPGDYGIVANVVETDRLFRKGAKAWLANGTGGEGWHKEMERLASELNQFADRERDVRAQASGSASVNE